MRDPDPFCKHCQGSGDEWGLQLDPEDDTVRRVLVPCRCMTPMPWLGNAAIIALAALLILLVLL